MSVKSSGNDTSRGDGPHAAGDPGSVGGRRGFLLGGLNWVLLLLAGGILYPVLRFLRHEVPKKPRLVKVHKQLAAGSHYLDRDFILFDSGDEVWAVSRICTHLGCRLNYSEKEAQLVCPCHESRFMTSGARVAGPARRDLPRYPVRREVEDAKPIYVVVL